MLDEIVQWESPNLTHLYMLLQKLEYPRQLLSTNVL